MNIEHKQLFRTSQFLTNQTHSNCIYLDFSSHNKECITFQEETFVENI